jgi:hypothetical protein
MGMRELVARSGQREISNTASTRLSNRQLASRLVVNVKPALHLKSAVNCAFGFSPSTRYLDLSRQRDFWRQRQISKVSSTTLSWQIGSQLPIWKYPVNALFGFVASTRLLEKRRQRRFWKYDVNVGFEFNPRESPLQQSYRQR